VALHRARQTATKRVCGELHWALARRMPERDGVHVTAACTCGAGSMAARLQRGPTALSLGRIGARVDQRAAVLARVNAALRRLRRWPAASIDPGCARQPEFRRRGRATPFLRDAATAVHDNAHRQRTHLSKAKRCSKEAGHLYLNVPGDFVFSTSSTKNDGPMRPHDNPKAWTGPARSSTRPDIVRLSGSSASR
jgi:hypothetical protein